MATAWLAPPLRSSRRPPRQSTACSSWLLVKIQPITWPRSPIRYVLLRLKAAAPRLVTPRRGLPDEGVEAVAHRLAAGDLAPVVEVGDVGQRNLPSVALRPQRGPVATIRIRRSLSQDLAPIVDRLRGGKGTGSREPTAGPPPPTGGHRRGGCRPMALARPLVRS